MIATDRLRCQFPREHYHRCPHCRGLLPCGDVCGHGQSPYDPYDMSDAESALHNGRLVFSGCECDQDCYDRKRQYAVLTDAVIPAR